MELGFLSGLFLGIGFWPFLFIFCEFLLLFAFVEFERGGYALASMLVTAGLLAFFAELNVFTYIWENPLSIFVYAFGYLAFGLLYSLFRWDRFGKTWRRGYDILLDENQSKATLQASYEKRPIASRSKDKIITWMAFWPWSSFWWLCSDFIKEVLTTLYEKFGKVYTKIALRHVEGIKDPSA